MDAFRSVEACLDERIAWFIKSQGQNVSFIELLREMPELAGDLTLSVTYDNVVLWTGLSAAAIAALNRLMKAHTVVIEPAGRFSYLLDGGGLTLPLARSWRQYTKPHWMPVVLSAPAVVLPRVQRPKLSYLAN